MTTLVPKFTMQNYTQIMGQEFQGTWSDWWSLADVVRLLCVETFRSRFASLDARRLDTDLSVGASETIVIGGKTIKLRDGVIAIKLALPSLRCCDYFFWNVWSWTHTWVDIILPKKTPIIAFQAGKVTRIKKRDWVTSNEWNCIVIQDSRGYFRWYEHLDRIEVIVGQQVNKWMQIGLCGSTGNSTQYHLHLQVDAPQTSPNPHWSSSITTIQQKTIDPLRALRAAFSSTQDLPYEVRYQDAIWFLLEQWYIQGAWWYVYPDGSLQRYEMALILHRILKKRKRYDQLTKVTTTLPTYTDVAWWQPELEEALRHLWQYGLMKWYPNNTFWPSNLLLYEQALALLWRSFFNLQDFNGSVRYQTYLTYFQQHGYLDGVSAQFGKPLLRKELFLLVWKVLK